MESTTLEMEIINMLENILQQINDPSHLMVNGTYGFSNFIKSKIIVDFEAFNKEDEFYSIIFQFYKEILLNIEASSSNLNLLRVPFLKENFIVFIECLIEILKSYKDAYNNDLYKINLSIIIGFISNRNVEKIVTSKSYYYLSIKELHNIFPNINGLKKMAILWGDNYNTKKVNILGNIKSWLKLYYINKIKPEESSLIDLIEEFLENKDIKIDNVDKYIEKYKIIIDKYLNCKVKEFGYEIERVDIFRRLFFELKTKDNLEEIISFLITVDELKEYFVDYKENNNDINFDLENEIKKILSSSNFFNLLIKK